jgi:hypothetical protein
VVLDDERRGLVIRLETAEPEDWFLDERGKSFTARGAVRTNALELPGPVGAD